MPPESPQADPWQAPPAYVDPELVTPPSQHRERPGPDDLPSYVEPDGPIAYGITDEEPADAGAFAGPDTDPVRGFFEPPSGKPKADDLPTAPAGSLQDGSLQDGSLQDGSLQDGSLQDGSLQDTPQADQWSTDQYSTDQWSPTEWSPAEEPAPPAAPPPAWEPVAQQAPDSSAERLEEIKDFYLTAEAIGEENVDKHFNELLDRQRELISQYFKESGTVKGPMPAETADTTTTGMTGTAGTVSADPVTAENPPAP
jgi:hypothetical protein